MTLFPPQSFESLPAIVFQFSAGRLHLLNKETSIYPGLTPAKLSKIVHGEWRKLVPEEFHPVVRKLAAVSESEGYTTAEFPLFWMGNTAWLRIFAAAVAEAKGKKKIIGLAQDVTVQRLSSWEGETAQPMHDEADDSWRKLRHDINSSLTTILMNCELSLESRCDPSLRRKIESILSEALRIDQSIQHHRQT